MFASFSAEILKLRKRPAVWMIIAAWMALEVMFGYVFPYLGYRTSSGPRAGLGKQALLQALPAQLAVTPIQGFPVFVGALAILIGGAGHRQRVRLDHDEGHPHPGPAPGVRG